MFDERIECYDVYKVETCGDAYMVNRKRIVICWRHVYRNLMLYVAKVASGLPERSEIKKHVSEIATMALDLLHASSYFKVPHSPNETVQVRIGIHTGSCGAGKEFIIDKMEIIFIPNGLFYILGIVGTKMPRYCLFGKNDVKYTCFSHILFHNNISINR